MDLWEDVRILHKQIRMNAQCPIISLQTYPYGCSVMTRHCTTPAQALCASKSLNKQVIWWKTKLNYQVTTEDLRAKLTQVTNSPVSHITLLMLQADCFIFHCFLSSLLKWFQHFRARGKWCVGVFFSSLVYGKYIYRGTVILLMSSRFRVSCSHQPSNVA